MSDPIRVSNPGAESLGFLPNGEEVMEIYIGARPPTVEVFYGQAPSYSSFGNKTSWGSNDWVEDSPTRQDIDLRDQEIKAVKDEIDRKLQNNANKTADTRQKLATASNNKAAAEKELNDARMKGSDKGEILRHEFKVALADLNEYALKTEIAGYDAFNMHGEASKTFADADSLRIGTRAADQLIKEGKAKEQAAKNADQITAQMSAEYERRKAAFDKLLADTAANGGADLAVFETQQAQLIARQTQYDNAVKTATRTLANADNALNSANQQLHQAENTLNDKRETPDGKTFLSPEHYPLRTTTTHQIFVKDPMFSGRMSITTEAEINNRANMDYLLSHSGLDYKRNILNDRDPVKTSDVEGDKAIYNAEVAEWDKLRMRLIKARDQITAAQNAVNAAKGNVEQSTNTKNLAQDALNQANSDKTATQEQLEQVNQNITIEKQRQEDLQQIKDAIKLSSDFFKELYSQYGNTQGKIAQELADAAKGAQLRSVDDALKSFNTFKGNFDTLYANSERQAIALRLESITRGELAKNLTMFSKAFGLTSRVIDFYDTTMELKKAIETNNWRPFFVKVESLLAGAGAGMLTAWAFSVILSNPLGVLGFAIIMAAVSALVNEGLMEKMNKLIGI